MANLPIRVDQLHPLLSSIVSHAVLDENIVSGLVIDDEKQRISTQPGAKSSEQAHAPVLTFLALHVDQQG